jgi:orotate phosphoribosyltransferase
VKPASLHGSLQRLDAREASASLAATPRKEQCTQRIIGSASRATRPDVTDFRQEFLAFAVAHEVLRFGNFVTKAGRRTPYFFNAGLFNDGRSLARLGGYYAEALLASGLECDQLFGPAYKGITLAAATAIAPCRKRAQFAVQLQPQGGKGSRRGWRGRRRRTQRTGARRRRRDHGWNVGARIGRADTPEGGQPAGVLIALDRMERGQGAKSAVQEVRDTYGYPSPRSHRWTT